jgi:PIN domain nuclease of toxin-antitoxin system
VAFEVIVLDTSCLIYWTLDPSRLSVRAQQAIQNADSILISSISIWEIGIKIKRRKLSLPIDLKKYVEKLKSAEKLDIVAVSEDQWITNLELEWKHRDPADRTIVALAFHNDCPLVTSDKLIRRFFPRAIW